jgi:hypothetical protein
VSRVLFGVKTAHLTKHLAFPAAGVAGVLLLSCMAAPPSSVLAFDGGRVLAADPTEAERVETLLARLQPELLGLLPDTSFEDLDVWVQDTPSLYMNATEASTDAEGLWSPTHQRIMLSRHADHIERTLAHELTHAALGESWGLLPGSMEEGLADHVSGSLCESGASRLRAGRLSSACLATGGVSLQVDVMPRADSVPAGTPRTGWSACIRLKGEADGTDPMDVFRLAAGLSSTKLESGAKRGFYGLAYLAVSRIVDREGYEGLQGLCLRAEQQELSRVPASWILEAAGLDAAPDSWRSAAAGSMGEPELIELVRMYPDFVSDAVHGYLSSTGARLEDPAQLEVEISLREGSATVLLRQIPDLQERIASELGRSQPDAVQVASAHR